MQLTTTFVFLALMALRATVAVPVPGPPTEAIEARELTDSIEAREYVPLDLEELIARGGPTAKPAPAAVKSTVRATTHESGSTTKGTQDPVRHHHEGIHPEMRHMEHLQREGSAEIHHLEAQNRMLRHVAHHDRHLLDQTHPMSPHPLSPRLGPHHPEEQTKANQKDHHAVTKKQETKHSVQKSKPKKVKARQTKQRTKQLKSKKQPASTSRVSSLNKPHKPSIPKHPPTPGTPVDSTKKNSDKSAASLPQHRPIDQHPGYHAADHMFETQHWRHRDHRDRHFHFHRGYGYEHERFW